MPDAKARHWERKQAVEGTQGESARNQPIIPAIWNSVQKINELWPLERLRKQTDDQ